MPKPMGIPVPMTFTTPRSTVPPLRVNTSMFREGYKGEPWARGDPSTVPLRDSKKSHVAKPDPFKEWKDFYKFIRSTYLYTTANPGEFPTNKLKVMFYLSYMKEGLPGKFAETVVQRMMDWEAAGLEPDLEFKGFMESLTNTFRDVNKRVTAQKQLLRSYQGKMTAEAFFQMFEQRVRAVNYEHGHHKYLIQVMKKALNGEIVDIIYAMQDLPSSWENFRDVAIHFDKRLQERCWDKQGDWRDRRVPPSGNNKGFQECLRKYELMEVDNSEVKKKTCCCCGSEDHFIRNCPKPDTQEKKKNIQDVNVEKDEKVDSENGWGSPEDFSQAQQWTTWSYWARLGLADSMYLYHKGILTCAMKVILKANQLWNPWKWDPKKRRNTN
jgi:hypothetical protein